MKRGDIVRCNLPTDYDQNGEMELYPRNCVFLGWEVDPETMEPVAARMARLTYNTINHDDEYEPRYEPMMLDHKRRMVGGIDKPALLRTGSPVDLVPLSSIYWGHFIDRTGFYKQEYLKGQPPKYPASLEKELAKGYELSRKIKNPRNYAKMDYAKTILMPSIDPEFCGPEYEMSLDEKFSEDFYNLDEFTRQEIAEELGFLMMDNMDRRKEQIGFYRGEKKTRNKFRRANEKRMRDIISEIKRQSNSLRNEDLKRIMEIAKEDMDAIDADAASRMADSLRPEQAVEDLKRDKRLENIPTLSEIIQRAHEKFKEENDIGAQFKKAVDGQVIKESSIEDLVNLGIGGLMREPDIALPEHLWKGRYMMLRIPSLLDSEEMDDMTNRPAALWRAWVRPDENGELKISHMMFMPCTRTQAKEFSYKMKTKPLDTTVKTPSFVIAERPVIVEVNAMNFQPNQPHLGTFYELMPNQVADLEKKVQLAQEFGAYDYWGELTPDNLPEDCLEIQLPEPPNEKMRQKLVNWGAARFVGGNKPAEKRKMGYKPSKIRKAQLRHFERS